MRTEAQKAARRKYDLSEKGKAAKRRNNARYVASGKRALAEAKRAEHPVSPARKAARKRWAQRNKWYSAADRAHRRMLSRFPLPPAHKAEIDGMYLFCSIFPNFEVDHIVPVKHDAVCGLHVLANLQVIERVKNKRKSNLFCPAVIPLYDTISRA